MENTNKKKAINVVAIANEPYRRGYQVGKSFGKLLKELEILSRFSTESEVFAKQFSKVLAKKAYVNAVIGALIASDLGDEALRFENGVESGERKILADRVEEVRTLVAQHLAA